MSVEGLLPCPFCGGSASAYWSGDHSTGYHAGCGNRDCEAEPSVWAKEGEAAAIAKWNTRAHAAEQAAPVEPSAECWRKAIEEAKTVRQFIPNVNWIEQRARELAQEGK